MERLYIATMCLGENYEVMPEYYKGFLVIKGKKIKAEQVNIKRLYAMDDNGDYLYIPLLISDEKLKMQDKFLTIYDDENEHNNITIVDCENSIHEQNEDHKNFKLVYDEEDCYIRDKYLMGELEAYNDIEFSSYNGEYELTMFDNYEDLDPLIDRIAIAEKREAEYRESQEKLMTPYKQGKIDIIKQIKSEMIKLIDCDNNTLHDVMKLIEKMNP